MSAAESADSRIDGRARADRAERGTAVYRGLCFDLTYATFLRQNIRVI